MLPKKKRATPLLRFRQWESWTAALGDADKLAAASAPASTREGFHVRTSLSPAPRDAEGKVYRYRDKDEQKQRVARVRDGEDASTATTTVKAIPCFGLRRKKTAVCDP